MKFCELRCALLFSLYLYGVHGRTGFNQKEISGEKSNIGDGRPAGKNTKKELHVNDPEVVILSAFAMDELNNARDKHDDPLLLSEVVKAHTHVISGNLTMLTLKVTQGKVNERCDVKILKEPRANKFELIHSKCKTITASLEPREVIADEGDVLDVKNEEVIRLSKMAVNELNKGIVDAHNKNYILEILKASARAVSGKTANLIMTLKVSQVKVMKKCEAEIQHQIWTHESKVTQIKCSEIDETVGEALNVNDPQITRLGALAMVELNEEKFEKDDPLILLKIIKATYSPARKSMSLTLRISQGRRKHVCDMKFWILFNPTRMKIKHSKCGTVPAKTITHGDEPRHMVGQVKKLNVNDPKLIRWAMMALVELYSKHPENGLINLLEIVEATRQTVAGELTTLKLKVSQGHQEKMCDVKITEQLWLGITKIETECKVLYENDHSQIYV